MKKSILKVVHRVTQHSCLFVSRLLLSFLTDCRLKTLSTDPLPSGPILVVANHQTYWDPFLVGQIFSGKNKKRLPLGFMASDHLFASWWSSLFLWLAGVDRAYTGKGLTVSLAAPKTKLLQGESYIMFPQGERSPKLSELKIGSATLLQQLPDTWVLPVYIDAPYGQAWKTYLLKKSCIRIHVGKPFKIPNAQNMAAQVISQLLLTSILETKVTPCEKTTNGPTVASSA